MANFRKPEETKHIIHDVLHSAAMLFLTKGYTQTTVTQIAKGAGIHVSKLMNICHSKEDILCVLVEFVLESQFKTAFEIVKSKTEDKVLYYAAETVMQLYMAESNEQVRELYNAAYSMKYSSEIIHQNIAKKLSHIFAEHLPECDEEDFYELEIASGGIIRGFMSVPCSEVFPMERKVRRYLETTLRVYQIEEAKIEEAIAFVSQFDFPAIAHSTIMAMIQRLEEGSILQDNETAYERFLEK